MPRPAKLPSPHSAARATGRHRRGSPPALTPAELHDFVEAARNELGRSGSMLRSKLGPSHARAAVEAVLVADGFELVATRVRRRLLDQIRDGLEAGTYLPMGPLAKRLGTSAKVATDTANVLVRDGTAHLVLRTAVLTVVPGNADVLSPAELTRLEQRAKALLALVARSRKSKLTLLRQDVVVQVHGLVTTPERRATTGVVPSHHTVPLEALVLGAVDAQRDSRLGLSFVPAIVKALTPYADIATIHRAMLDAAEREQIELRPESGLHRLDSSELEMSPAGPHGTRLSWARRITPGAS